MDAFTGGGEVLALFVVEFAPGVIAEVAVKLFELDGDVDFIRHA